MANLYRYVKDQPEHADPPWDMDGRPRVFCVFDCSIPAKVWVVADYEAERLAEFGRKVWDAAQKTRAHSKKYEAWARDYDVPASRVFRTWENGVDGSDAVFMRAFVAALKELENA